MFISYQMFFSWESFFLLVTVLYCTTFFECNCFWNTRKILSGEVFYLKDFKLQDCIDHSRYFQTSKKQLFGTLRVWKRSKGLNLISKYWCCIPDQYHRVVKLFHNFEALLWRFYHVTMKTPYLTFFGKLTQRWRNIVIPTSRSRCLQFSINVVSVTSIKWCEVNLHVNIQKA